MYIYLTIIITLISVIFLLYLSNRFNFALDSDLNKPQAIHTTKIARVLGIPFISIFILTFFYPNFINNDYIIIFFISLTCSLLGLFEDIGFKINPITRFIFQLIIVSVFLSFFNSINPLDPFDFLPHFLQNDLFMASFTIFAILTISNSINFIDGCNGLVIIYMIVIKTVLFYFTQNIDLKNYCSIILVCLIMILFFNFPKPRAFLGDFGAYFLGFNICFLTIYISNNGIKFYLPTNEWFFANLLLYPSYEIFTTVLRRLKNKKSPFFPDNLHTHSIIFKLLKLKYSEFISNYLTSIIVMIINLFIVLPLFFIPFHLFYLNYFIFFALLLLTRFFLGFLLRRSFEQ